MGKEGFSLGLEEQSRIWRGREKGNGFLDAGNDVRKAWKWEGIR